MLKYNDFIKEGILNSLPKNDPEVILQKMIDNGMPIDNIMAKSIEFNLKNGIDYVLKTGFDINDNMNITPFHAITPLLHSIEYIKYDIMCYLIENGSDVNKEDEFEYNSLNIAFLHVNSDELDNFLKKLIDSGAKFNESFYFNYKEFCDTYDEPDKEEILKILFKYYTPNKHIKENIMSSLPSNNFDDILQRMINEKKSLYDIAVYFIKQKYINGVKYAVENGLDVNDVSGIHTLLHLSILMSNYDIFCYLIDNGANVNMVDKFGRNSLHLVWSNIKTDKLSIYFDKLIDNGAVFNNYFNEYYNNDIKPNIKHLLTGDKSNDYCIRIKILLKYYKNDSYTNQIIKTIDKHYDRTK